MQSPIQAYLEELHGQIAGLIEGEVASYIPELGKANPDWYGICLVTMDGVAYAVGDTDQQFTIQSISKALVYAAALADRGQEFVARKVGVEPSGDAFNSISLDPQTGAPLNPMINAGAIATTGLVAGETVAAQWKRIEGVLADFVGRTLAVDEAVCRSESETGHRNRAIAWMLKNFGIIDDDPMAVVENYFRQCSVLVSCRDLAYMAATLANGGIHPLTGKVVLPSEHVERVLSVMATCGMYDYAGSWFNEVGVPAKSGVGGGIIAVVPGCFGIGVFSPRLDAKGNSVRGIETCKRLSKDFAMHAFSRTTHPFMALGRIYTAKDAPSRRQPAMEIRNYLNERADRIKYLTLHGFLAVDGVEFIVRRMQELAAESDSYILDMHRADGISDSGARLLNQARVRLADQGIALVCSRIHDRPALLGPLSKQIWRGNRGFLSFEDNDLAVEWCENRLLSDAPILGHTVRSISDSHLFHGVPEHLVQRVESISRHQAFDEGEQILRVGQDNDGRVFFIESGHVSILLALQNGAHQRIASLGPGMVFGEMVLLGQATRSASVYADTKVACRIVEVADLNQLAKELPALKIMLLENMAKELAARLRDATRWIAALA